jgi:ABC-type multidrug transport system ATPase subunit
VSSLLFLYGDLSHVSYLLERSQQELFFTSKETISISVNHIHPKILCRSSGIVKPGEMCLVLGCPGSGCTTFLKVLANQRQEYASVSGEVRFSGMDAQEMAKYYKGEVVYNQEG